ncbi:Com family DNA-binding transcriptional regulator [Brevundimonas diminuta]|uniref:Com family DNA-binding transcriptional regulator n=1 Tax=Brevundimonas diminuta TaxID=293 RepID=UPI0037CABB51
MCKPQPAASREAVRCASCAALLFKAQPGAIAGVVEIKCRRCSALNLLRPSSPQPIADRATDQGNGLCGSSYRPNI